jgi:dTDP-glucose 4,6-dehydratase
VVAGDIRDEESLQKAVKGIKTVFHLASLIGIPYSYEAPVSYVRTNIEGTANLLRAALASGVNLVIHTSTSEVYGTAQYVPIDERHPLNPQSPYAATKVGADQVALSFHRSYALPVKIVRPFNTYGPRQSARAVIPAIISQIVAKKRSIRLGNLHPTRDFTYVDDTVQGFLEVAKSKRLLGEVTHVGTNWEISVGELARLIAGILNRKIEIVKERRRTRPKESEVQRLFCDSTKLRESTGWKPRHTLRDGLLKTIHWIEKHLSLYRVETYHV